KGRSGGLMHIGLALPLRETKLHDTVYTAELVVSGELPENISDEARWQPLTLALRLRANEEVTEHVLTSASKPRIESGSTMPADYGFRTYYTPKDKPYGT